MAYGFKPTTARPHNIGGAQKDKAGVDFVSTEEVKEKEISGMSKSPQNEAVVGIQKNYYGTMPPNKDGQSNCFHCGSNHHWE